MNQNDFEELTEILVERIEDVLNHFGLQFVRYNDRVSFPCPIHHSDNSESLSLFVDGHTTVGNWKCWTCGCESDVVMEEDGTEKERGCNIFGFIRGILSVDKDYEVSYKEAIDWAKKFCGFKGSKRSKKIDEESLIKKRFINETSILLKQRKDVKGEITRRDIRSKLVIPAQYFIGRNYSEEILDKYDVGFCQTPKTQMFNRVVVPVYDDNYEYMVGCIGRTIQPKCINCGKYHYVDRSCPSNKLERMWASKWVNSKGFKRESTLYNIWFAKEYIKDCGTAILVEGQGDVWRIEEAGIHLSLGMFGDSLTDEQKILLDSSGALNLIILTDNDKAGLKARKKIEEKCKRSYNCYFLDLPKKDMGAMTTDETKNLLGPLLEKVICHNKF